MGNNSLLTYVNQTDPMYIDFSIAAPERMRRQQLAAAGRLRFPDNGHYKAQLRLLDGSMYKGEGEVTFIDSQVQPSTGVIKAARSSPMPTATSCPASMCACSWKATCSPTPCLFPRSASC